MDALFPDGGAIGLQGVVSMILWKTEDSVGIVWTYVIIHCCSTVKPDSCVIAVLDMIDLSAIQRIVRSIINVIGFIDQADSRHPVIGPLGPIGVRRISSIRC